MSDGPHRSLPMSPRWRRVAMRTDRDAFAPEEASESLALALEQDFRAALRPSFLARMRDVVEEPTLFGDDTAARLGALRPAAEGGLERVVLDNLCYLSAEEAANFANLQTAIAMAAHTSAIQRGRQMEEHFLRTSTAPRARDMRGRYESAIGVTDFTAFASSVVAADPERRLAAPAKRSGLDDGVKLP